MGYFSLTMNSYMVSLKYDFEELRSKHWLYTNSFTDISADIPVISKVDSRLHQLMLKLMEVVKWMQRESKNTTTKYRATKTMIQELITPETAYIYLDFMYYNDTLNLDHCVSTFNRHLNRNAWSFYTLHLLMDVNDIPYLKDRTPSTYVILYPSMRNLTPVVYKLFLNVTIQYIQIRFNNGLSSTFVEFETYIDEIFEAINAYT